MAKLSFNVRVEIDLNDLDLEYDSMSRAIELEVVRQVKAEIGEAWRAEARAAVKKDAEIRKLIEQTKRNITAKMKAVSESK